MTTMEDFIKKFTNCSAWAKGWYQHRPNLSAWWMDLAHCIHADGWCGVNSKKSVADWVCNRLDQDGDYIRKQIYNPLGFLDFRAFKEKNSIYYGKEELSEDDYIILYFHYILMTQSKQQEGIRPSDEILPFHYEKAYVYEDTAAHKNVYVPSEMKCDVLNNIQRLMPNFKEQEVSPYSKFEYVESQLVGKDYTDVLVQIGSDADATIKEVVLGEQLLHTTDCITIGDTDVELGIFSHSIGFNPTEKYELSIEYQQIYHDWDDMSFMENRHLVRNIKPI